MRRWSLGNQEVFIAPPFSHKKLLGTARPVNAFSEG